MILQCASTLKKLDSNLSTADMALHALTHLAIKHKKKTAGQLEANNINQMF